MRWKVSLAMAAVAAAAFAQPPAGKKGGPPSLMTQQVKPNLYLITGAGGNTTVRVTNEGLIVVDGKLPGEANYNALLEQIKTFSPQPVKYLFNTHHHADHTGNNERFLAAGVQVVAHENLNKNLVTYQSNPKPAPASVTYPGKEHTIRLDGAEAIAYHFGRAHTSGDSVVYFPDLKVVAVSDVVTTGNTGPLADYAGGGSFLEWSSVLDNILKLDFDTAIPGNGNPLTRADIQAYKTKIDTFVSRAKEAVRNGVASNQLMAQIKTDDLGFTPRVPMAEAFYEELTKTKQ